MVVAINDVFPNGHKVTKKSNMKLDDLRFKIEGRAINMLPLLPGQVIGIANQGSFVVKYDNLHENITKIHEF